MSEFLASLPPILVCLIICAAKIIEISIQSLKTCMMVKGQRLKAAGLFLGSTIEGKIALGTTNLELIANDDNTKKIVEYLKKNGKGNNFSTKNRPVKTGRSRSNPREGCRTAVVSSTDRIFLLRERILQTRGLSHEKYSEIYLTSPSEP